jgi:hypothetical protein
MTINDVLDPLYDFTSSLTFGIFPNAKKVKASVDEADKEFQRLEDEKNRTSKNTHSSVG